MASIWNTIQNLFVPHDNLRTQAQNLINQYDTDGDGTINTAALEAAGPMALLSGVPAGTFIGADVEGNNNGKANLKEIRNHLKEFDTGPYGNNNKTLDGVEQLQMSVSDLRYAIGGYGNSGGYGNTGGYGNVGGYGNTGGYGGYGGYGNTGGYGNAGGFGASASFGASAGIGGFFQGGGGPSAASQAEAGAGLSG